MGLGQLRATIPTNGLLLLLLLVFAAAISKPLLLLWARGGLQDRRMMQAGVDTPIVVASRHTPKGDK
jgi:hypothetical protein